MKEILVLYSVWKLINKWDNIWKHYKTITFWDIQVSDVKVDVDIIYNKFNNLMNELKNKKWEVLETTHNNIDEFRYLLPMIDDLKNPAIKNRHWDEIRNIINK